MIDVVIRNESARKGLYRGAELRRLANRVCAGEGYVHDAELSLLLCDDPLIAELNREYRHKDEPTDVLSFAQDIKALTSPGPYAVLGDIVISLETVEQRCAPDEAAMRGEVRLLFCHGLLHLLDYRHDTLRARKAMAGKQAEYLGLPLDAAWPGEPLVPERRQTRSVTVGR